MGGVQALPAPPDRLPDFDDDFAGPRLREDRWLDHYLPHWTTPDRSQARYDFDEQGLRLRIDEDQLDWRPEDAPLRVSNVQTGNFQGAHRHRPDGLVVRTESATRLLWAPSAGRVDITVTPSTDAGCMLAAWTVGTEHLSDRDSGEVCVFEIDAGATVARCGVKAHHDDRLTTEMSEVPIPAGRQTWTAIWGLAGTTIGCEGVVVKRSAQAPLYPQFLLIDLWEIGPRGGAYPKTATLHRVRAWTLS